MSDLEINLMNNYVFQNKFRAYFHEDLSQIIHCLSVVNNIKKSKSVPYNISGKFGEKMRTINFPNIFTYAYAVNKISNLPIVDFGKISSIKNKMKIDFASRKFQSNSYSLFLEERINHLLSTYDKMYKIDIQSFYKSIYTHVFEKMDCSDLGKIDEYIRIINNNKTNGLLLGNLLSTLAANEIMEYLTNDIKLKLPKCEIYYFSDQFYIFYNNFDYSDDKVLSEVEKLLKKDYFELKINERDTEVCTHEDVIKEMEFKRYIADLCKVQKSKRGNIDNSLSELVHFFNLFIQYYYSISQNKRQSFVEVVLKSVFSSTINIYRMVRISKYCKYDKYYNKMINILVFFLKQHPSLIILYIEMGLWDLLIDGKFLDGDKRNELFNHFYKLLECNFDLIEGVYYFHICYQLTNILNRETFLENLYKNNKGKNQLIDSIIIETLNIKGKRNEIINLPFNDSNWLLNYTKLVQIRFNLLEDASTNCLIKTINNCKKKKIKIIKSLSDIKFNNEKKDQYDRIVEKFESNQYRGTESEVEEYFDYNL